MIPLDRSTNQRIYQPGCSVEVFPTGVGRIPFRDGRFGVDLQAGTYPFRHQADRAVLYLIWPKITTPPCSEGQCVGVVISIPRAYCSPTTKNTQTCRWARSGLLFLASQQESTGEGYTAHTHTHSLPACTAGSGLGTSSLWPQSVALVDGTDGHN